VSPKFLIAMLREKVNEDKNPPLFYNRIKANPLPNDVEIVRYFVGGDREDVLNVLLESESFKLTYNPPTLPSPVVESVYLRKPDSA